MVAGDFPSDVGNVIQIAVGIGSFVIDGRRQHAIADGHDADDQLDGAVDDLVAAVLAAPRNAVVETKALLMNASTSSLPEQLAAERAAQVRRLRDLSGVGE